MSSSERVARFDIEFGSSSLFTNEDVFVHISLVGSKLDRFATAVNVGAIHCLEAKENASSAAHINPLHEHLFLDHIQGDVIEIFAAVPTNASPTLQLVLWHWLSQNIALNLDWPACH
jgi:hypothetical protein